MDRITLENYRCFRERQSARLAPLTLLVGENSTGKTSFMAMVRALWDVAYSSRIPDFREQPYDLGSFNDIAHYRGAKASRANEIRASFDSYAAYPRAKNYPHTKKTAWNLHKFCVRLQERKADPVPVMRILSNKRRETRIEHRGWTGESHNVHFSTPNGNWGWRPEEDYGNWRGDDSSIHPLWSFIYDAERHTQFDVISGKDLPGEKDFELLRRMAIVHRIPYISSGLSGSNKFRPYSSAPIRSKPHRIYHPSRPIEDPEGNRIPMYLADIHSQGGKEWERLKGALTEFGKTSGLFDEIIIRSFETDEGSDPFQLQVRESGSPKDSYPRNLIDVGYGVSQVLPVIVQLLRDDGPPMFLLQQPEVHLHPRAQAALGSLFCKIASAGRPLIIETHSDYILDRVRLDVRDKETKLQPSDVSILFFERQDLDVQIHSIRIDEMGNILDAPQSYRQFFMDETKRDLRL